MLVYLSYNKIAGIAQSVEQLIRNQQVAGSSPVTSSRRIRYFSWNTGFFYISLFKFFDFTIAITYDRGSLSKQMYIS